MNKEKDLRRQVIWLYRVRVSQPGIGETSYRQTAIKVPLLLMVAVSLDTERSCRGGKGRGENEHAGKFGS